MYQSKRHVRLRIIVDCSPKLSSKGRHFEIVDQRMEVGDIVLDGHILKLNAYLKVWVPISKSVKREFVRKIANRSFLTKRKPILW